jgi:hypothetical protein
MTASRPMESHDTEISVKGRRIKVPSVVVDGKTIVATGGLLKVGRIHDEEWMENSTIDDIKSFLSNLAGTRLPVDVFSYTQPLHLLNQLNSGTPLHSDFQDLAVVPLTTFTSWWESLPQESRKNTRKAEKRGVVARVASFDDMLVRGIKSLYDETPVRQGRRFWHFGKDLETVRRENATFMDRSDFIAAYLDAELIGFIKIVYVGKVARIMQILSKSAHSDKKPTNLLLTKAIEACCNRGMTHFVYGQYYYGNKGHTPITEFKRRNGFERVLLPRYFVPITLKGRAAVSLRLHRGIQNLVPGSLANFILGVRARIYQRNARQPAPSEAG